MKKTVVNSVSAALLSISAYILLFQGFAFPTINDFIGIVLKIIAAICMQIIFLANTKSKILRFLPLIICAAIALWGGWLYLTSESWFNVSFIKYVADYCSPLLGSVLCLLVYKK